MKLKQSWKNELLALVNSKNSLQLTLDDVKFELTEPVSEVPGTVVVTIKPNDNSRYFNEQSLTYVRRDIAKNFTGIPLRVIVKKDTAVRDIISTIAKRYGLVFDTTVDFLESELNKQITFADTGIKDVTVPVANTSYVWAGNLQFNIANDTLSLITIIKKTDLTNLVYLDGVEADTSGSLLLATAALVNEHVNEPMVENEDIVNEFINVLNALAKYGDITGDELDAALQAYDEAENRNKTTVITLGDIECVATEKDDWEIGHLRGRMVLALKSDKQPELDNTFRLFTNGGDVSLTLNTMKDISIDWGDGNKVTLDAEERYAHHTYADNNQYQIEIVSRTDPDVLRPNYISGSEITEVIHWATTSTIALNFVGCDNLATVPDEIPTSWTTLDSMFESCTNLNDPSISNWNTSNITSMNGMFGGCTKFNQPLAAWDVSSVTDIGGMFVGCSSFNQDLSGWRLPSGVNHRDYDSGAFSWQTEHKPTFK
ncbi:BspA family leucine-rich repeat surface protein [Escherichia coli]|nr:BspA family leucine-rich repeat surface protein [Escherichia coli]